MTNTLKFFLETISYIYGMWKPNKLRQNGMELQNMGTEEDRSNGNSLLKLFRNCHAIFPWKLPHVAFQPAIHKGSNFFTFMLALAVFCFFDNSHPNGHEVISHCGFFFSHSLSIYWLSTSLTFTHFWVWIFFLMIWYTYILWNVYHSKVC